MTVPQIALCHSFLLHGIFAVSALHLALPMSRQDSDREELIKAAEYHQSEAIKIFTPTIGNLTPSQYDAAFLLSNVLVIIALAFPLVHNSVVGRIPDVLDDLIRVFAFVRKMTEFSMHITESVKDGEIGQLTSLEATRPTSSETIQSKVSALHKLSASQGLGSNDHAFHDIIDRLANLLARWDGGQEIFSASFLWIAQTPSFFFDRLQARCPLALVVLAHYCIVLDYMSQHWWIQTRGRQVLEDIRSALEPNWQSHIAWPVDVVGT